MNFPRIRPSYSSPSIREYLRAIRQIIRLFPQVFFARQNVANIRKPRRNIYITSTTLILFLFRMTDPLEKVLFFTLGIGSRFSTSLSEINTNLLFCPLHLVKIFSSLLSVRVLLSPERRRVKSGHHLFPFSFQFQKVSIHRHLNIFAHVNYSFPITSYFLNALIFSGEIYRNTKFHIQSKYCDFFPSSNLRLLLT